jgi:glycerol-3-phosphate dehydrogenase
LTENNAEALALAEVEFCVLNEMAVRSTDFFERRSGRLFFQKPSLSGIVDIVINKMASMLQWDNQRLKDEIVLIREAMDKAEIRK